MENLFLKLFNMSIAAGWTIAAILLLRLLLCRAPKYLRCALWAVAALRLVCPFSLESAFSLIPSAETIPPAEVRYAALPAIDTGLPAVNGILNPMIQNSFAPAPGDSVNPLHAWFFIGSMVWAAGLAVLLTCGVFSYLRLRRRVEEAVRLCGNVYLCDAVESPFILGLVHPRIYLPSDMEDAQIGCVLAHERAHLRRGDHWWKPLGYVLLAAYWFNPFVWIAYLLFCRDIELACDERTVHHLNLDERKAYSEALVACSMRQRVILACPLAFGEVGVKERVKTVLNYRKPAFWLSAAAMATCIVMAVCFLTNPMESNAPNDLAEMLNARKDELTEQIGSIISEAEAVRYSITDWELVVNQIDETRADCSFAANWISSRKPKDDPMILGMYQTADSLADEEQKALALKTADEWLAEMQSWPEEEYLEHPIVILREGKSLALYYPYVMDGVETLIPLQKFVEENWTEDAGKRYQEGVDIIEEAVSYLHFKF